jgi:hypothetical protein
MLKKTDEIKKYLAKLHTFNNPIVPKYPANIMSSVPSGKLLI